MFIILSTSFSFNRNYPGNHTRKNRKHTKKLDGEQEGDKPVYPNINQRSRRAAVGQEHRHCRGDRHLRRVWCHHVIRLHQRSQRNPEQMQKVRGQLNILNSFQCIGCSRLH